MNRQRARFLIPTAAAAFMLLTGCASGPIYQPGNDLVRATPQTVLRDPTNFNQAHVIWGGTVVDVTNASNHSEIEILAYPLDGSQRPQTDQGVLGRFIAMVPGYVEPLSYPHGSLITVDGHIDGTRQGKVGKADYDFPVVNVTREHRWKPEESSSRGRSPWSNLHLGIGIGIGSGIGVSTGIGVGL